MRKVDKNNKQQHIDINTSANIVSLYTACVRNIVSFLYKWWISFDWSILLIFEMPSIL